MAYILHCYNLFHSLKHLYQGSQTVCARRPVSKMSQNFFISEWWIYEGKVRFAALILVGKA